ncbi:MAG: AsmA family protein [Salinarimonadaceae bacterium]|nr:MAG: AsmA family protein [Salinarimonadaceae bacterium]
MLIRRALKVLLPLAALAGIVMAIAPWTISSRALVAALADQLQDEFGVTFTSDGRAVIAFLPLPRVKFEDIAITAPDGGKLVTGGELRGRLAVTPLLYGRIIVDEISLANSRVDVAIDETGASAWDDIVADARAAIAGEAPSPDVARLALAGVQVHHHDARTHARYTLRNVDLTLDWPNSRGRTSLSGSFALRGETVQVTLRDFTPAAFLANERSPIDLRLAGRFGRLSVSGTVSRGVDSPWLIGRGSFETTALRDLLIWSGHNLPLGPLVRAFSLEGEVTGVGGVVSWPSLRITLGSDRMEGALTARSEEGRISINGTLAADTLTLDDFAAPFLAAAPPSGPWRFQRYDLSGATAADLDLRLSANTARLRGLSMSDVALGVLVKKGRIETTLSRAEMHGGLVRGRLALTSSDGAIELRAQGGAENVDLAAAFRDAGVSPWLTGRGGGEFILQARGPSAAELARSAAGQASVHIRDGQFVGLALYDALRRFERQPLTASLNLHSGSTPFEEAHGRLDLESGIGRIVDAGFESTRLSGVAQGVIFVPDRRVAARVAVESKEPVGAGGMISALSFDVQGPWRDIAVLPDANALIQRSGAARLLLDPTAGARSAEDTPAQ